MYTTLENHHTQSKPVTIKKIAQILNVSVSTVSRALHDHRSIGQVTRQKVKKLAKDLNYEPNQTAVFLQQGRTLTIGVILPELSESFFSSAVNAIEDVAFKKNYTVLFAQSHDDELKEKQLVEKMKSSRVDGLLISVGKNTCSYEHFERLRDLNIPVVFFDRIPAMRDIHYVVCNIEKGTIDAVSYLLERGHRAIGIINGPSTLCASGDRRQGYIKALTKNRLKFDPLLMTSCDLTEEGTKKAIDQLLANKRKPTAIITFNDYTALFAIKYIRSLCLNTGRQIEFVSYANLPITKYMENAPVASVEQFPYLQGQKAADILLDLLALKEEHNDNQPTFFKIVLESQLIEVNKSV